MTFSYPNSDHTAPGTEQRQSAAPRADSAVNATEPTFSYAETNKPAARGTPADELPETVRALRANDQARQIFSPQNDYRDSGIEDALKAAPGLSDDDRAREAAEYREIFADHGFSTSEARQLVSLARQAATSPPDEATEQRWQEEAWSQLVRANGGEKGAHDALNLAKQLVTRDPRMRHLLEVTRLGSHPKIVQLMADKARAERANGRLK